MLVEEDYSSYRAVQDRQLDFHNETNDYTQGDADDTTSEESVSDSDTSAFIERLDRLLEAEDDHVATCQKLYDEYTRLVSSIEDAVPMLSAVAYEDNDSIIRFPLNEVARDDLIAPGLCKHFFESCLERVVFRGFLAASHQM